MPRTELEIVWDGPVRGLEAHRVSLTNFAPALTALLKAIKRIGTTVVQNAVEPISRGRLTRGAQALDVELASLKEGSGGFSALLTFEAPPGTTEPLFNNLAQTVGREFIDSVRAESANTLRNLFVREYLQSLPTALTRQDYRLKEDGRVLSEVTINKMDLPSLREPLPSFQEVVGMVSGVGFEPGKLEVRIKGEGSQVAGSATAAQVEAALSLRGSNLRALFLSSADGYRLLTLTEAIEERPKPFDFEAIFTQWDEAFKALA